ncbi:uncharacterized protein LOC128999270 [Macrosteles quadrilineatus]|uniref:uncharacterized protein LOC128999270 n=1 Tax=Macrosteles quadrilineatus TaxID=74068 RepID=UPI0023E1B48E|nr:uncharacterized protein LOC128999270 [Macrosteles quadrilineatus]
MSMEITTPISPFYHLRYFVLWASFFYIGLGALILLVGHLRHLEVKAMFEPYYENHECDDPECSKVTRKRMAQKIRDDAAMAEKERIFREKKQKEREEKKKRKEEEKRRKALEAEAQRVEE